jgi:sugar O-acyltransferase (sialic acid O-acetyltransferase NeuD family)
VVVLDDDPRKHGTTLLGIPVVAGIDALAAAPAGSAVVNLVARTTSGRAAVHARIRKSGVPLATLVHPGVDAQDCVLGAGVLVYEQAVLSPLTRLGDDTCVFMRAVVGHDAIVGAGCVLAPGAVLNARVVLEDLVYVGSNASILPDVHVGAGALIGANSLVTADVPAGATVLGVPGQVIASAAASGPHAIAALAPPPSADLDEIEAQLVAVMHAVLGHTRCTATDRFFDVGGNSLRAVQFVAALQERLGIDLPITTFYAHGSVRDLAQHLTGSNKPTATLAGQQRAQLRRRMLRQ